MRQHGLPIPLRSVANWLRIAFGNKNTV